MTDQETKVKERRCDPIVEEVREIRQKHARKFNYDPEAIFADLKRYQAEIGYEVVSFPARRVKSKGEGAA